MYSAAPASPPLEYTVNGIRQALSDADRDSAERLAHSLKGLHARMGADCLHQTMSEIEQALRLGQDNSEAQALWNAHAPAMHA